MQESGKRAFFLPLVNFNKKPINHFNIILVSYNMKRAIYCLIYTAILFSGCQKDDTEPSDNNNQNLISQNLQSHNGEVSQFAYIIPVRRYIGSGDDITGRYCVYYSVKEPVLDI